MASNYQVIFVTPAEERWSTVKAQYNASSDRLVFAADDGNGEESWWLNNCDSVEYHRVTDEGRER